MSMRKYIGRAAVAALAGIVVASAAAPVWAGQINLSTSSTTTQEKGIVTGPTVSVSATGITITAPSTNSFTNTVTVSNTYNSTTANVSVEIAQSNVNYTSPNNNFGVTGNILQTNSIASAGITQAQTTGGNANVTVASNGLYDGSAIAGMISAFLTGSASVGAGLTAAMALTPGFALQNSNAVALDLLAAAAVSGAAGTAIDVKQNGLNEYSPNNNYGVTGSVTQNNNVAGSTGIVQSQMQGGNANVQAAHNVILYGTLAGSGSLP